MYTSEANMYAFVNTNAWKLRQEKGFFLYWNEFHIDERSVNRYNQNEERRDEHDDAIHAAREEYVHVSFVAD